MRISLIVATLGRSDELAALFRSLEIQQGAALDVIVVDQNADDRLVPVIAAQHGSLPVRHLRSAVANANHARNLGLAAAEGEVVAFPDDDCWWPSGVLQRVVAAFSADPDLAVLTGPAASPAGGLGSGRWRSTGGAITLGNVWTSVIEFNLFIRRDVARDAGGFDETLGPGTPFGSAEGNDLVARLIRMGQKAHYDPDLQIVHPDKRLTEVAVDRAVLYGAGLGRVLRRHASSPVTWLPFLVRPVGGMLLAAARGQAVQRRYYAATLTGRVRGFLARTGA
jgi:glycosyltransferase involved in cell wall biosynthesis